MDSHSQMSDAPDQGDLKPEALSASKNARDQGKLKDSVKSTGRLIWAAIGVMATLGGVLGLYQFIAPSEQTNNKATDALLIAMVAEGVITAEQAQNLTNALTEPSVDLSVEETVTLKAAMDDQDKTVIIAMAKMLNRKDFQEGLDLLEASAETADDWLELGRLAWGRDRERSLRAAENAAALNPENFTAITFLVQAQAAAGDYQKAIRSADIADMIANTPVEQLRARIARLNTHILARDIPAMKATLSEVENAIDAVVPIAETTPVANRLSEGRFRDHPAWIVSSAESTQASALFNLNAYEQSIQALERANEWISLLAPHSNGLTAHNVKTRETKNFELLAQAFSAQDRQSDAYEAHEKVLANWTELAESGDASANEAIPIAWAGYGQTAYRFGDIDKARTLYERGQEIIIRFAAENPENEDWQMAAEYIESLMLFLAKDETPEAFKESYRTRLSSVVQALADTPKDEERRGELIVYASTYSTALLQEVDENLEELDWLIDYLRTVSAQMQMDLGANYFSVLVNYNAEYIAARVDEQTDDIPAARGHYETMLSMYDVMVATPDVQSFDSKRFRTELYGLKLGALFKLASFKDEYSPQYARTGLALSQQLDDAGQLRTSDQYYLKTFGDFVSELENQE